MSVVSTPHRVPAGMPGAAPAALDGTRAALRRPDEPLPWDHFSIGVEEHGAEATVHLRGGLDFVFAERLERVLAGIDSKLVTIDLHRLTFIDSTGLAALASSVGQLRTEGRELRIGGAQGHVRRVLEVSQLAGELRG